MMIDLGHWDLLGISRPFYSDVSEQVESSRRKCKYYTNPPDSWRCHKCVLSQWVQTVWSRLEVKPEPFAGLDKQLSLPPHDAARFGGFCSLPNPSYLQGCDVFVVEFVLAVSQHQRRLPHAAFPQQDHLKGVGSAAGSGRTSCCHGVTLFGKILQI